jgi:hypothetical protein
MIDDLLFTYIITNAIPLHKKVHSTLRKFGLHCDHALMAPLCPYVNYVSERSYYYQHLLLKGMRCITNKSCQMGVEVCGIIKIGFTLHC